MKLVGIPGAQFVECRALCEDFFLGLFSRPLLWNVVLLDTIRPHLSEQVFGVIQFVECRTLF